MRPTYGVKAWQEDNWWLARVVAASDGTDPTPVNALTQARTLTKIEQMARDLIATILDASEDTFDLELEYDLPHDVGELLCEAKGARAWLDAAQELWQERAAVAARALTEEGYSLRETAKLLGLSHQRVDQLLAGDADAERSSVWAVQLKDYVSDKSWEWSTIEPLHDMDIMVVVRNLSEQHRRWLPRTDEMHELKECVRTLLATYAEGTARSYRISEKYGERKRSVDA